MPLLGRFHQLICQVAGGDRIVSRRNGELLGNPPCPKTSVREHSTRQSRVVMASSILLPTQLGVSTNLLATGATQWLLVYEGLVGRNVNCRRSLSTVVTRARVRASSPIPKPRNPSHGPNSGSYSWPSPQPVYSSPCPFCPVQIACPVPGASGSRTSSYQIRHVVATIPRKNVSAVPCRSQSRSRHHPSKVGGSLSS